MASAFVKGAMRLPHAAVEGAIERGRHVALESRRTAVNSAPARLTLIASNKRPGR
ncbi:MAG: hypothetical protein JO283_00670 [Bradyrhizobium sp.]|jgi:hypothetical protein|nr:hypothetical protein [Bradyrhizobium sp.]